MTSPDYFEALYDKAADPWQLAEREYELRKFEVTAACLPRRRYLSAFEPGCSIGVLTTLLASRCEHVLAMDQVPRAVETAQARVADSSVTIRAGSVPADWPRETFDLIVISELLYYLGATERRRILELSKETLADDGHLVLVHWRHAFEEAQCTGDQAHHEIASDREWEGVVEHVEQDFRLDVFARA